MKKEKGIVSILLMLFVVSACQIADVDLSTLRPIELDQNIAIPLGNASYTVGELIKDLEDESLSVTEGDDMTLTISFSESTVFDDTKDIIDIGSINNQSDFAPNLNLPISPTEFEIPFSEEFKFTFPTGGGEIVDSAFFNSGTLKYDMLSTFVGDIAYSWTIVGMKDVDTNVDLSIPLKQLDYTGSFVRDSYTSPLDGLKSVMYKNADGDNEFRVLVSGVITIVAGAKVLASHKMTFDLTYENPGISKVFGFFGNEKIELQNQTVDMSAFADFGGDGLSLNDPSIEFIVNNSFGLDMEVVFDQIRAENEDGDEIFLSERGDGIDGVILAPMIPGDSLGGTILINKENSNIDDLLNFIPTSLDFSVSAVPNPASTGRTFNFLTEASKISITSVISIPLDVKMDGFSTEFDFALGGLDLDQVESLKLNVTSLNQIPFDGSIDLNFVDELGDSIYKILGTARIDSPEVGPDGRTVAPVETIDSIVLDREALDALADADKIIVTMNVSTFEKDQNRFVTIYSDYILNLGLSLEGKLTQKL